MAKRKPLRKDKENASWVVRFRHPLRDNKVVRVNLGADRVLAESYIEKLNAIFTNEDNWYELPPKTPKLVRDAWIPPVKAQRGKVPRRGKKKLDTDSETVAALEAELETWKSECLRLEKENKKLERELEQYRGRTRKGPCPTLTQAKKKLLRTVRGTSPRHQRNIACDLGLFVDHFGPNVEVDDLREREVDIHSWLRGLDVSAGRRQQIRIYALKLLEDSGVRIDRKKIPAPKMKDIRKDRGSIRWLERHEAETLAAELPERHQDAFMVQVALGLRPEELLTLTRQNFTSDLSTLILEPLGHLGLKTGSRTLRVPMQVRGILKRRFGQNRICFPDPKTEKPWADPRNFDSQYNRALSNAAEKAGVETKTDCRIGRRTCASLLIRSGLSTEQVAVLLGDRAETVRQHYAALLPSEVDSTPAALTKKKAKKSKRKRKTA